MLKILGKTLVLAVVVLGWSSASHAQDMFVANVPGNNQLTTVPGPTNNTGPNQIGVTITEKYLVPEEHIVEYAEDFCTRIGKSDECEQAFVECAVGDSNSFDCDYSPIGNQPGNGGKNFICSKQESDIETACAQRLGGIIVLGPNPRLKDPNLSDRFQGVVTVQPQGQGHRYVVPSPNDLSHDAVVGRILGNGRKVVAAPVPDGPQEASPVEDPTVVTEPTAADAPSQAGTLVEGAGCSLAPALTGSADPWEWVMLALGILPALRAWRHRD